MVDTTTRFSFSKKNQRHVSRFIGRELLYDYLCGSLDEERKKAVEAYLQTSKEAQSDFQKLQDGLGYAQKLSELQVSPRLLAKITTPSSYLTVLFQKARFHEWPTGLKWGLESLVVVFVIVTFLTAAPWEKLLNVRVGAPSSEVILAEINKTSSTEKIQNFPEAQPQPPEFIDEGIKSKETLPAKAQTPAPEVPTTPVKAPRAKAVAAEEATAEGPKSGGFIYRGKIAVTNLEAVGPKIKDKIVELGGRKAGEVDLGWQKTPGSAYFHFTIPEVKYQELQGFLSGYGHANIDKEKHPRIMPDGIIRLIITVDEASK